MQTESFQLVVVGGNLAGLSLAIQAGEAGLDRVLILEPGEEVAASAAVGHHALSVEFKSAVRHLLPTDTDMVLVLTERSELAAQVVAVASRPPTLSAAPPYPIPSSLASRVHLQPTTFDLRDADVLVVGTDEEAAEYALRIAFGGGGVVLAMGGSNLAALSRLTRRQLLLLEAERRATILWHSQPEAVEDVGGYPMAYFNDRRTPDLQFDHVIYRLAPSGTVAPLSELGIEVGDLAAGRLYWLHSGNAVVADLPPPAVAVAPGEAWETIRKSHFPNLPPPSSRPRVWRPDDRSQIEELRTGHYNATITYFDRAHSDLWVLRVRPDHGDTSHLAGQYASLGLGYWEPRADGARDPGLERHWDKLIRRSYSISSPIFDHDSYLIDPSRTAELEFYIVLVPPSAGRVPALSPRLALKQPGDRIYLGPKVAGRYTLMPVHDPMGQVVFLATGTGEAPHNAMTVELLRRGHRGPIVSAVSVRHRSDLGYLDQHRRLEERFANYHYLPLVTRDAAAPKLYIQDLVRNELLSDRFGVELDPNRTHVYMCGNPAMIGLPTWDDGGRPIFPPKEGACELLSTKGFTIDRRGLSGNTHYEEYW